MLQMSIIITVGVLIGVSLLAWKSESPALKIFLILICEVLSSAVIMSVLFPVLYQAVILGILWLLFFVRGTSRKLFLWSVVHRYLHIFSSS